MVSWEPAVSFVLRNVISSITAISIKAIRMLKMTNSTLKSRCEELIFKTLFDLETVVANEANILIMKTFAIQLVNETIEKCAKTAYELDTTCPGTHCTCGILIENALHSLKLPERKDDE